jgi:hypothetical protein
VGAVFILGNTKVVNGGSKAAPSKTDVKNARKDAKCDRKGQKRHTRCIAMAASDDGDDKEADNSGEEYVTAVEHDFKRHAW